MEKNRYGYIPTLYVDLTVFEMGNIMVIQNKCEYDNAHEMQDRINQLEKELEFHRKKEENLQRLIVVIRDSNDAITMQDLDGNITAWNHGAEKIYGYSEAEALKKNIFQIVPTDKKQETQDFLEKIKKGELIDSYETQRLTKEGRVLDIWLTVTPISDAEGRIKAVATTERDITKRKQVEESLKISTQKTEFFAYSVMHDLKSPAISMYGLAQRLQQKNTELSKEKIDNYCNQILRTSSQILNLVEKINIYISEKENPLNIEKVSLAELVEIIRDEFSIELNIRSINFFEQGTLPKINADRISILRVLRNLVDNALKYGGEELSEIDISYKETDQFHIFSVHDNGIGLSKEECKKLFSPFKRKKTFSGNYGSGLGLAIVKEIVEHHGGKVWTEQDTKIRKGITFCFSISKTL